MSDGCLFGYSCVEPEIWYTDVVRSTNEYDWTGPDWFTYSNTFYVMLYLKKSLYRQKFQFWKFFGKNRWVIAFRYSNVLSKVWFGNYFKSLSVPTKSESSYDKMIYFLIFNDGNRFVIVNWQRNWPYRIWTM